MTKININNTAKYFNACSEGDLETIKDLINTTKVNVDATNSDGQTALIIAAHHGYLDIVKFLDKNGADKTIKSSLNQTTALDEILGIIKSINTTEVIKYLEIKKTLESD